MKRPTSLTIVGAAWFLIGLIGALNDAAHPHSMEIPGANFTNLFVGLGLLKGWRICRWYGLFLSGVSFVFMLPFAPWALLNTGRLALHFPTLMIDDRPHETISLAVIILLILGYLFLFGWVFAVLRRADVRDFFTPYRAVTI